MQECFGAILHKGKIGRAINISPVQVAHKKGRDTFFIMVRHCLYECLFLLLLGVMSPTCGSANKFNSIAVVRPFSPLDATKLPASFDIWDILPPTLSGSDVSVDLILVYSQSLDNSLIAEESVQAVKQKFMLTNGWNHSFSNFVAFGVDIDPELDLYRSSEQDWNPMWVNGPNRQFERLVRSVSKQAEYDLVYLMEMDSVPVKSHWLDTLTSDIETADEFAILGSKYRGDRWDSFYDKLPWSLVNHINGNAVYNLTHPLFLAFVEELEDEADTVANFIPYDYRIAQMIEEVHTGVSPKFGKDGSNYSLPSRFVEQMSLFDLNHLVRETSAIGNYASTNLVPSYYDDFEVIIHGAKMRSPWEDTQLGRVSLVVSDWEDVNFHALVSTLDDSIHPFSEVIIMLPEGVQRDTIQINSTTPVRIMGRKHEHASNDLCTARVTTPWFMLTNSYYQLRKNLQLMTSSEDGKTFKPVVSNAKPDFTNCLQYPACTQELELAKQIHPSSDRVYQTSDFVFHTRDRNKYCHLLSSRRLNTSSTHPGATSFMAFLEKIGKDKALYETSDRNQYGSRPLFLPLPPVDVPYAMATARHLEALNNTNVTDIINTNSTNTTNTTGSTCSSMRSADACLALDGCSWRTSSQSCYTSGNPSNSVQDVQKGATSSNGWVGTFGIVIIVLSCIGLVVMLVVGVQRYRSFQSGSHASAYSSPRSLSSGTGTNRQDLLDEEYSIATVDLNSVQAAPRLSPPPSYFHGSLYERTNEEE
eukprot:Nitzschia sp. Nitz4//scaffold121_size67750//7105//9512//NITZ4_006060-RA/size67750-augustus-gene-0.119-mRNA-1//1//CDS//3329534327//3853//frame0